MTLAQQIFSQFVVLVSLFTLSGVLLHDTHLDKAFVSASGKVQPGDTGTDTSAHMRSGSSLHPHAPHLKVNKDGGDQPSTPARHRERKELQKRRVKRGYHGDNFCMPLAGEWA